MGVGNNNLITLNGQNFIDMGGASNSPLKFETNFPNFDGDLNPSDPRIVLNPITEVIIGWTPPPGPGPPPPPGPVPGSALRVSTINGLSSINGLAFPQSLGVPIGSMLMWPVGAYGATPTAPSGYLLCDGRTVSKTTYSELWNLLQNIWSPTYPTGPADPDLFYLPDSRGRIPTGGVPNTYVVQASFQGVVNINLPTGGSRQGARFNQIQMPISGGPAQLYRGMVLLSPFSSGRNIVSLFAVNTTSGSGWFDDMYILFQDPVFPGGVPTIGTNFLFIMGDSANIPVVGLTNTLGGNTAAGYGKPYKVQQATEVAVHNHNANGGQSGGTTTIGSSNPIQGTTTGNPNGQFTIDTVGNVAEAYPMNPANFGVNYIIKAL
jgi:microcystin-dependent protein